ncbi:polyprenyl synthetase family protein [bacterium NHP-B]|nr:polyprenyl synthetase family protein [bacterium NHP-B]
MMWMPRVDLVSTLKQNHYENFFRKTSVFSLPSDKPSLTDLLANIRQELGDLDRLLTDHLDDALPMFKDVSLHLMGGGGKRLRPSLLFVCAKLFGDVSQDHIKGAMCIELIHNATLLHDDVLDRSSVRRGRPTAHHLWTESHSILTGDFLLCKALELLTDIENWDAVRLVHKAATYVIQGQALEMTPPPGSIGEQEAHYEKVIMLKTAPLFEASAGLAGILGDPVLINQKTALQTFGHHLGIAFQLIDDILDYRGQENVIGKKPGQDFREKKVTLPVIVAFQQGTPDEQAFWTRVFLEDATHDPASLAQEGQDDDFHHALTLLEKHDAFKQVLHKAKSCAVQAKEALSFCDQSVQDALGHMFDVIQEPLLNEAQ